MIVDSNSYTSEQWLSCPECNGTSTHHTSIEIFNRESEDSETGTHILVDGECAFKDNKMAGNPSNRRNGIKISFWCEECATVSELCIAQHKGTTYISCNTTDKKHIMYEEE